MREGDMREMQAIFYTIIYISDSKIGFSTKQTTFHNPTEYLHSRKFPSNKKQSR